MKVLAICILSCLWISAIAQYDMRNGTVNDCNGSFTDSGGNDNGYGNNENFTLTFCSDGSTGSHMRLNFLYYNIAPGDELCFFDGVNTAAPDLDCHNAFNGPFSIQATAGNASGCVTVRFRSNGNTTAAGWLATLECVPACQEVQAEFAITSGNKTYTQDSTGFLDICLGDSLRLTASGLYPENNTFYTQSDATTEFLWDLNDGSQQFDSQDTTIVYTEAGGYRVGLQLVDQFGCRNSLFYEVKVRVAPPPTFVIGEDVPQTICLGDTANLNALPGGLDPNSDISIEPTALAFNNPPVKWESLPLPDGTGNSYITSIFFGNYEPSATLDDINQLLRICLNIEHSWLRDLEIEITCPNGTTVTLHDHPSRTGGEVFLGAPDETDEATGVPVPGEGWDYCWTPDATNGTWIQTVNSQPFLDTLPAGDYSSADPLEDLLGCPLNGEWELKVTDLWGSDNGFIFFWSIELDPSLNSLSDSLQLDFDLGNSTWTSLHNPLSFDSLNALVSPSSPGRVNFEYVAMDSFGCTYDTLVPVFVLSPNDSLCYACPPENTIPDTNICSSESVRLNAVDILSEASSSFDFVSNLNQELGEIDHPDPMTRVFEMDISGVYPNSVDASFCGICIDANISNLEDVIMTLITPTGVRFRLLDRDGNGSRLSETCFIRTASDRISTSAEPYTGEFLPVDDWSAANGVATNGMWRLEIEDANGDFSNDTLFSWSLCFSTRDELTYEWNNGGTLSCDDCPDPVATPDASTNYIVTVTNVYGCQALDTARVTVNGLLASPVPVCSYPDFFTIQFDWEAEPGMDSFYVFYNGDWYGITDTFFRLDGLSNGDSVGISLVASSSTTDCPYDTVSVGCLYNQPCFLEFSLVDVMDESCYDGEDGQVVVMSDRAYGEVSFQLNGMPAGTNEVFPNLSEGTYTIVATDTAGCTDSVQAVVEAPDSIVLSLNLFSTACFGSSTGTIQLMVENTQGVSSFLWSGPANYSSSQQNITNLTAGTYCVTVTDAEACQATICGEVLQPSQVTNMFSDTIPSCSYSSDGKILAEATGGIAPYTYRWNSGLNTALNENLSKGTHFLTITDDNGCELIDTFNLSAPDSLIVTDIEVTNLRCFGDSDASLQAFVQGGTSPYFFAWNDPRLQMSQTAVDLTAGTYQVTVTDDNGCMAISEATIDEPSLLTLQLTADSLSCFASADGQVTATVNGGTPNYDYAWSNNAANTNSIQNLPAGTYGLTLTDANGCDLIDSIEVFAPELLRIINIDTFNVKCFGNSDGSLQVFAQGGIEPYGFQWNDPGSQNSQTAIGLAAGTYRVTVTDANGCTDEAEAIVRQPTPLSLLLEADSVSCFGNSDGQVTATVDGGTPTYEYRWSNNTANDNAIQNLTAGNYSLTVTDANGCEIDQTVEVFSPDSLVITNFETLSPKCNGGSDGNIQAFAQGGTVPYSYQWNDPESQDTQIATDLAAGTYQLILTDANGCFAESQIELTQPTLMTVQMKSDSLSCFTSSDGQLTATVNGGTPDYSYAWSNNTANTNYVQNLAAGIYSLVVTDANGCQLSAEGSVFSPPLLLVQAEADSVSCFGAADGLLFANAEGGVAPYTFLIDSERASTGAVFGNLASSTYEITALDANGCEAKVSVFVPQPAQLIVDAGPDMRIDLGDSLMLSFQAENIQGTYDIVWNAEYAGTFLCDSCRYCEAITSSCENPIVKPLYTIDYEVELTDSKGCTATNSMTVFVDIERELFVPTGFTPDNDGLNDRLHVHGTPNTNILYMRIFDRWGELVYETNDININDRSMGWDGTFKSKPMPTDVYVWYLEAEYIDGVRKIFKGNTQLIRK